MTEQQKTEIENIAKEFASGFKDTIYELVDIEIRVIEPNVAH